MLLGAAVVTAMSSGLLYVYGRSYWHPMYRKIAGSRTTAEILERYSTDVEQRLRPYFTSASIAYPPKRLRLLALKGEQSLELWAADESQGPFVFIRDYEIKALSGGPGPKQREGDRQVPEGIYRIEALNPNSSWHLSIKLNYPNEFDRQQAEIDGRRDPGSNIFIHGKAVSVGCLAMGDTAIEELFVLSAAVDEVITVLIAPYDPRQSDLHPPDQSPTWTAKLYQDLHAAFSEHQRGR